jgi:hypothetical protein
MKEGGKEDKRKAQCAQNDRPNGKMKFSKKRHSGAHKQEQWEEG